MMAGPLAPSLAALAATWRADAERCGAIGDERGRVMFAKCAAELEAALATAADEALTLAEASVATGFSPDHLRHLVSLGVIPNAGKRGAPRIRRADLPRKAATAATGAYDVEADALALAARRRAG
jgi:hypothetical protein